jgi:hypothetical protein
VADTAAPALDPGHWQSWAEEWDDGWIRAELAVLEKLRRRTPIQEAKRAGYRAELTKREAAG